MFIKIRGPGALNTGEVVLPVKLVFKICAPFEVVAKKAEKARRAGKVEFRRLIAG